jgi:ATP-dependent DNA helicase RecG
MQVREISEADASALASREESHFFDHKAREVAARKIEVIAVAFANADGGEFVIGIDDQNLECDPSKRWRGFSNLEEMNGLLQALFTLNPPLDIQYDVLKRVGDPSYVLQVKVEKGASVHKTSEQAVYQRQGAQSLPLKDPSRIAELGFAKGAFSYEDTVLAEVSAETIVDSEELGALLDGSVLSVDPLDFAINQNLLDQRSWSPRVAAALLFAPVPSAVVPKKCAIKVTRYETAEDDPERDHLAEQFTVEAPAFQAIRETARLVKSVMSSVEVWTAEGLRSLEYPPEAIWETVVNAIIHRDYSISDDIQILIFDNRIEILSPGKLPGYVTVENILDARYSRNPKLVRTLARYKDAPNKDLGEGLNTTFQKMKEWGFKNPEISVVGNYVRVVLPHARLAAPTVAIMDFLRHQNQITNRQARELTGIRSENLVKVEFYKLRDEGLIERVPGLNASKSAWRLTAAGKSRLT